MDFIHIFLFCSKVNFSLIKSHFRYMSINLNYPLALVVLRTLLRLSRRITRLKTLPWHWPKKEKQTEKLDFALVFDSLKIQSCRLNCSFPDNLNHADFKTLSFQYIRHKIDISQEPINILAPKLINFRRETIGNWVMERTHARLMWCRHALQQICLSFEAKV